MPIALSTARSAPTSAAAYGHHFVPTRPSAAAAPATLTDWLRHIREFGAGLHFARNKSIFSGAVRLCRNALAES
jgi:hypothetical protein